MSDVHVYFIERTNLEVILCDECDVLWQEFDLDALNRRLVGLTHEQEQQMIADIQVSAEGFEHMCQGHAHAVCKHLLEAMED